MENSIIDCIRSKVAAKVAEEKEVRKQKKRKSETDKQKKERLLKEIYQYFRQLPDYKYFVDGKICNIPDARIKIYRQAIIPGFLTDYEIAYNKHERDKQNNIWTYGLSKDIEEWELLEIERFHAFKHVVLEDIGRQMGCRE